VEVEELLARLGHLAVELVVGHRSQFSGSHRVPP
jgi:hypothetical protein